MAITPAAPDDLIASSLYNEVVSFINGTSGGENPGKFIQSSSTSVYGVTVGNRDTTNGLALKIQYGAVDSPTTIALFNKTGVSFSVPASFPGGITSLVLADGTAAAPSLARSGDSDTGWYPDANGLAWSINSTEVARQRVGGLEAKLRDKGGAVFFLDAYASGTTINDGAGDPDAAWTAALAAVTAAKTANGAGSGGTILLGPGIYLAPTSAVTWVDNVTVRGAGMDVTVVKHRNGSTQEPFNWVGRSNMTICDLTVDGNRTNNNNISTGFNSAEIALEGTDNAAIRVRVRDFNKVGISCGGTRTVVAYCKVGLTAPPGSYTSVNGSTEYAYDGLYGISSPDVYTAVDIVVHGNQVYGIRSAGIFVGGKGFAITGNHVRDCHRGPYPAVGGGQMALSLSKTTTNGDTVPQNGVIAGNTIADTVVGTYASGLELNSAIYCSVSGNTISGQPATGIAMEDSTGIQIVGNTIFNCVTGIGATANTSSFAIIGNSITTCSTTGISLSGTTTHFSVIGNYFDGNPVGATGNINNAASGTNYEMLGNIFVSGTAIPNRHGQPLTILSQAAGTAASLSLGRTAVEGVVQISGSSNLVFAGVAAGDMIAATSGATHAWFGTGGAASVILGTNGSAGMRIDSSSNKILHFGGAALATSATAGYVWLPYSLGKPTGNPGSPTGSTGSVPLAIDLTNNKLCFWTGAAWVCSANPFT